MDLLVERIELGMLPPRVTAPIGLGNRLNAPTAW
jgi:hypothetical protein